MDIEQLKKRVDATARYVEALENAIENKKERILAGWSSSLPAYLEEARQELQAYKIALHVAHLGSQEGVNLVSDDAGRWAVSGSGMQSVLKDREVGFTEMVGIVSTVQPEEWKSSIFEALEAEYTAAQEVAAFEGETNET